MPAAFAVGIDLGTTNCALAVAPLTDAVTPATAFAIAQLVAAGETQARPMLPSFLYLPAEAEGLSGPSIGLFARAQGAATPTRVVSSAKSWLSHTGVDRRAPILPWQAPDEVPKLSPLDASARYLAHMRAAWDAAHPEAPLAQQELVLTVPASFDAVARELTSEACRIAGLGDAVRLLEEPQAALYAWLSDRGASWRDQLSMGDVIVVIDIGGGTTDFSLISVNEEEGRLQLERVAVGEHLLLGGDNMDLALAHTLRGKLGTIDEWQFRALTQACRDGKEALLADPARADFPISIAGRSSKLLGGTLRTQLLRADVDALLLDGFLPVVAKDARPASARRVGLQTLGLPYAQDAAITRHLAAFLSHHPSPTAVLFNGGVSKSPMVRERLLQTLSSWSGSARKVLSGADPELAVSRGAAYYAQARRGGGVKIRSGTAQAYYIGFERAGLAVPGMAPQIDALCIAPFGMEEGSEVELRDALGLVVGEPVSFRFFGSATRRDDRVGAVVDPAELTELAPIETALAGETGRVALVKLHARVTELGTLELSAVETADSRWKLSFDVRVQ